MSKIDYAPTRHYIQHQKVSPRQYASDTWIARSSLKGGIDSAQNWRLAGLLICLATAAASCVGLYFLIGRLAGIVG